MGVVESKKSFHWKIVQKRKWIEWDLVLNAIKIFLIGFLLKSKKQMVELAWLKHFKNVIMHTLMTSKMTLPL